VNEFLHADDLILLGAATLGRIETSLFLLEESIEGKDVKVRTQDISVQIPILCYEAKHFAVMSDSCCKVFDVEKL